MLVSPPGVPIDRGATPSSLGNVVIKMDVDLLLCALVRNSIKNLPIV